MNVVRSTSAAAGISSTARRMREIKRDMTCLGSPSQTKDQDHQVDDEQQHDRQLQHQHRAVVLIGAEDLVEVVQGLELVVDRAVPVGQVEAVGQPLVDARQVPVAEEFGDIRQLIGKARQIDADL